MPRARRPRPPLRRPWLVLGLLVLSQWLALLAFALGVSYDEGPVPLVVLAVAVLHPVALLCVYWIAERLAGRLFGYWAAALWVAVPFAGIPLFDSRYRERYTETVLPQGLGLSGGSDFPAAVALLVSALFAVRALRGGNRAQAGAAGLAAGAAGLIEPAALLILPAPALALAAARRPGAIASFALGVLPALVALALWRPAGFDSSLLDFPEWTQLRGNVRGVKEYFWSVRLLEWAPVAGVIGVARRSPPVALLLAAWFVAFLAVRGANPPFTVENTEFYRVLIPAYPAYVLLIAAIPLLAPAPGRLAEIVLGRETRAAQTRR